MLTMDGNERTRLIFHAEDESTRVSFEPLGHEFFLKIGHNLYLDLPVADLRSMQVSVWSNGIAVWISTPGDHRVLDNNEKEILRLWG
jgi:hypothetical protein